MVVCLVGFLVSAIFLALYLDAGRREQETFDQLASMVEAAAKEDDQEKEGEEVQKLEDKDADEAAGAARLQQYAEIYTLNPDLVGPGTSQRQPSGLRALSTEWNDVYGP